MTDVRRVYFPPGEKLSKQQLQHSNIIKKLRAKEKESEVKIAKHSKKLKEQEDELKQLQQVWERFLILLVNYSLL